MARIVVCGYMIRHPVAGLLLAYFQHLLGLHRLGHDVVYVEESGDWPTPCYDPTTRQSGDDPRAGLRILRDLLGAHGLEIPAFYVRRGDEHVEGGTRREIEARLAAADLLLNLGGVCWLPEFELCGRRALLDMDPLFTQVGMFGGPTLERHHVHFTYGANIGRLDCTIPSGGARWLPAVPPVVPELWPVRDDPAGAPPAALTTIASWNAYGRVQFRGESYGQKDEEFLRILELPRRTTQPLELALAGGEPGVRERLRAAGWGLRDPGDLDAFEPYRAYIGTSRGEFSVAKHAYVKTRSGWFSDRSVCYLAAGRPVVLQDTGFGAWLPSGRGVLAFASLDEAAACIEALNADYAAHRRAAREIAAAVFDYRVWLPRMLAAALEEPHAEPSVMESAS